MATCWVLDHPAHVRALADNVRDGSTSDLVLATDRPEVRMMLDQRDGHLPSRRTAWLPRARGALGGLRRMAAARRALRRWTREVPAAYRMVAMNAPLLPWAGRLAGLDERWCLVDTEAQHRHLRWLERGVTDLVVPTHWREDLDGGCLQRWEEGEAAGRWRVHRLDGAHQHLHLRPIRRPLSLHDPPRLLVRRLLGDGSHDDGEVVPILDAVIEGFDLVLWDEAGSATGRRAWDLLDALSDVDGVITQSTTFAAEAALLGVPTLLVSRAERGFLDRIKDEGWPLFRHRAPCEGEAWLDVRARWLTGLALTDALDPDPWPEAGAALRDLLA